MKVLAAILIFISVGVIARAQTPAAPAVTVVSDAKVTGGLAVSGNRSKKNSPFATDAVSESMQS